MKLVILIVDNASKGLEASHVAAWCNLFTMLQFFKIVLTTVLGEEQSEGDDSSLILLLNLVLVQPCVNVWPPADISVIDVQDTTTRDSSWGSIL